MGKIRGFWIIEELNVQTFFNLVTEKVRLLQEDDQEVEIQYSHKVKMSCAMIIGRDIE